MQAIVEQFIVKMEVERIKKAGYKIYCSFLGNIWRLFPGGIAVRNIHL